MPWALVWAALAAAAAGGGEPPAASPAVTPPPPAEQGLLVAHAYTLQHQPATEAMALLFDLLSPRGTVELQPGGNTVVIRDTLIALQRILPVLAAFDHPVLRVRLEIQIVQASAAAQEAPGNGGARRPAAGELPAALVYRLRELLRYRRFALLARAAFETREGETITYSVGQEYRVRLRVGTLLGGERLRLHGFQLARVEGEPEPRALLETDLNLWRDEPMVLGLARSEASDSALMVVLTARLPEAAAAENGG